MGLESTVETERDLNRWIHKSYEKKKRFDLDTYGFYVTSQRIFLISSSKAIRLTMVTLLFSTVALASLGIVVLFFCPYRDSSTGNLPNSKTIPSAISDNAFTMTWLSYGP